MGRGADEQTEGLFDDVVRQGLDAGVTDYEFEALRRSREALRRSRLKMVGKRVEFEKAGAKGTGLRRGLRGTVTGLSDDLRLIVDWDTIESDYLVDPHASLDLVVPNEKGKDRVTDITLGEATRRIGLVKNQMNAYFHIGLRVQLVANPKSIKLKNAGIRFGRKGTLVSNDPETGMIEVLFDRTDTPLPVDQLIEQLSNITEEERNKVRAEAFKKTPVEVGDLIEIVSSPEAEFIGRRGVVERINNPDFKLDIDWDEEQGPLHGSVLPGTDTYKLIEPAERA